jgi:hypothetical protein
VLRWGSFTLLIAMAAGIVRGLIHGNYRSLPILVPFLIATFVLAVLLRVAAFSVEQAKHRERKEAAGQT